MLFIEISKRLLTLVDKVEKNMKLVATAVCLFLLCNGYTQSFLNGSFENNQEISCNYNMPNGQFTTSMQAVTAYGSANEVDIQTIGCGFAFPQAGNWFISVHSVGIANLNDSITMKLSSPLTPGSTYKISYAEQANNHADSTDTLLIGYSLDSTSFGTEIFRSQPPLGIWANRSFTFSAGFAANYIT